MHYSVEFIYVEFNVLKSFRRIGRCFTDLNVLSSSFICYLKAGTFVELTLGLLLCLIHLKYSGSRKFIGKSTELMCFLHEYS